MWKYINKQMEGKNTIHTTFYMVVLFIPLYHCFKFEYKIGNKFYGSNETSCYEFCQRGQVCKIQGDKTICTAYCGDGILAGIQKTNEKGCDDGNYISGDGCSKCLVDPLFSCSGAPSKCDNTCGNSVLDTSSGEQCDDGNSGQNDGCTSDCKIGKGWKCSQTSKDEKSKCQQICGDGLLVGKQLSEGNCDDKNIKNGDGCNQTCKVEKQFTCCGIPSVCKRMCGNGVWDESAGEECDDGNMKDDDGCTNECKVDKQYWTCKSIAGFPSVCQPICGDGNLVGKQLEDCGCDDGNKNQNDGCLANCSVALGWDCKGQPSKCQPICGDGLLTGYQRNKGNCDDFNDEPNDGCFKCKIEPLYECSGEPSICKKIQNCGNEEYEPESGEQCDNGLADDQDGCSNTCKIQQGWVCESQPNKKSQCKMQDCKLSGPSFPPKYCYTQKPDPGCKHCRIVDGWYCYVQPDSFYKCKSICGDNIAVGQQVLQGNCDTTSKGCKNCQVEPGWTCTNSVGKESVCKPICGDGVLVGDEISNCDDGNIKDGDGCSKQCKIQEQYTCYSIQGPSKCIKNNTCIQRQDKTLYCFTDCSKLYYNKLKQSCSSTQGYCNDLNSIAGDGCSYCKLDPTYLISQNIVVPSPNKPQYQGYRISYPTRCGNQILDDHQQCDFSVENRHCHKKCNYKSSKCGDFEIEMEEKCDYFWGCSHGCRAFQSGWTLAPNRQDLNHKFLNPKQPRNRNSYNMLIPQLMLHQPYITQILSHYYHVVEQTNFDLSNLTWAEIQDLFKINNAYFSPQDDIRMYHPLRLMVQLFVSRLSQMNGQTTIKFYYKTDIQKHFLIQVMSEVLMIDSRLTLKVQVIQRVDRLKRHY